MLKQEAPIFIVGMARSGTTLMSSMLAAHPNIAIPCTAFKFISQWTDKYQKLNLNLKQDFEFFWSEYSQSEMICSLGIEENKVLARIFEMNSISHRNILACTLAEYAKKLDKQRWGNKDHGAQKHINRIIKWFPNSRIIWMFRDPRSVVASNLAAPWGQGNIVAHSLRWLDDVSLLEKHINDPRIIKIKYESLVTQPESILKQICNFIGEEYTRAMIDNRSEENSPIISQTGWNLDYLKSVLRPIDVTSIDKWKLDLSSSQIAIIERITKNKMISNDYQPVTNPLNSVIHFSIYKAKEKIAHQSYKLKYRLKSVLRKSSY